MRTSTTYGCLTIAFLLLHGAGCAAPGKDDVSIGVYDSRAIAIAYAGSSHNPVAEKMREYEAASVAGDERKVQELEAWGQRHQRQLHRQG